MDNTSPHQAFGDHNDRGQTNFHHNPLRDVETATQEENFKQKFVSRVGELVAENKAKPRFHPDFINFEPYQHPSFYSVAGDNSNYSLTWTECLRSCALYARRPKPLHMFRMKAKLQSRYTHLFAEGAIPPLGDQEELLVWACAQRQDYEKTNELPLTDAVCTYEGLMKKYGPDVENLKKKVGSLPGIL